MMHYSNWLIGVKNRASLRNACKPLPGTDWGNRGNVVDVQNNNPQSNEKTSELMVTAHLWSKGNDWGELRRCKGTVGPAATKICTTGGSNTATLC